MVCPTVSCYVHRDADETASRIGDYSTQLDTEDCGNSLPTVQSLMRTHDVLKRNLVAVEGKVSTPKAAPIKPSTHSLSLFLLHTVAVTCPFRQSECVCVCMCVDIL